MSRDAMKVLTSLPPELAEVEPLSGELYGMDEPIRVLVTDDEALNRRLLRRYLERAGMEVLEAVDGVQALQILAKPDSNLDVVILDLLMPGLRGEEVLARMRADSRFRRLPVLVASNLSSMSAQEDLLARGASDYLHKPVRSRELVARVRSLARLKRGMDELDDAGDVLMTLARSVEAKDEALEGHCERLSLLSVELGRAVGLGRRQLLAVHRGGVLHDIGKVGIPDAVLFKRGKFDEREWEIMKQHPTIGDQIIAPLRSMRDVRPIVRHHHERWNGSGYPDGLSGEDIPITARVLRLADAYDALRTKRVYKPAFSHDRTVEILREEAAKGLWDPKLQEVGIKLFSEFELPDRLDYGFQS